LDIENWTLGFHWDLPAMSAVESGFEHWDFHPAPPCKAGDVIAGPLPTANIIVGLTNPNARGPAPQILTSLEY
jgi:hypothetical protein